MIEWLELVWFFITHPGMLIFAIAMSGAFGFWIVQSLVVWYDWMNMTFTLLSPDYIWFWLVVAAVFLFFIGVPLWWIAISFSRYIKLRFGGR